MNAKEEINNKNKQIILTNKLVNKQMNKYITRYYNKKKE